MYSVLQIFPGLEATIREFARCDFYFGHADEEREAQPPKIVWEIESGDPGAGIERISAVGGAIEPKSFDADWINIVAVCHGAATPSTAPNERDQRRQAFAASEHLMCCVRWALKKSTPTGFLGKGEVTGWTPVDPSLTDRSYPIRLGFRAKLQLVAPQPLISDPPHTHIVTPHLGA